MPIETISKRQLTEGYGILQVCRLTYDPTCGRGYVCRVFFLPLSLPLFLSLLAFLVLSILFSLVLYSHPLVLAPGICRILEGRYAETTYLCRPCQAQVVAPKKYFKQSGFRGAVITAL